MIHNYKNNKLNALRCERQACLINLLKTLQAQANTGICNVPDNVYDIMLQELTRMHVIENVKLLKYDQLRNIVKDILKYNKLQRYYEDVPYIIKKITTISESNPNINFYLINLKIN